MSEPNNENATWLPNLVGGVSIWKLAVDLNEPKFFDGRLLVPETEGSESLPVTVRWDLTGLVSLREAQSRWPEEVGAAIRDFQSALDRVAKVFATPNSGFDKYKQAFTVPSLDADGGSNYFYSHDRKKLFVINWGASPRSMGGRAEYVFGYQDWGRVFDQTGALSSEPQLAAALATGESPALTAAASAVAKDEGAKKKDEPKEEKAKDEKQRPWWIWPLFALIAIALVLLALFLLRTCEEPTTPGPDAATDALVDGATDGATSEGGADAATDAASDATADAGDSGDAATDAGDAGDGGGDAGDAGKDGGQDAGLALDDDDDDEPGGGGGGGGAGGSGTVIVKTFPGGGTGPGAGARTSVHRRHYHEDAVAWRVTAGTEKLARTEQRGSRYDVWLTPGKTFEGVKVEWQDKAGKWHPH